MKKYFIISLVLFSMLSCSNARAASIHTFNLLKADKDTISVKNSTKTDEIKALRNIINKQTEIVNKHDLKGLNTLYAEDFINNDGFTRDVYFKLVKDTWETYPDISYNVKIKDIRANSNYASIYTDETAIAIVGSEDDLDFDSYGELTTSAKCIYNLEKRGDLWLIKSEDVIEENSALRFGSARFIKFELNTPQQVLSGKEYTSTLEVNLPANMSAVASINREKIIFPQKKGDDAFRVVPEEKTLERVFNANTDNVNEYNIAAVALTTSGVSKLIPARSMNGAAFIMNRINVISKNNYLEDVKKIEQEEQAEKASLGGETINEEDK